MLTVGFLRAASSVQLASADMHGHVVPTLKRVGS